MIRYLPAPLAAPIDPLLDGTRSIADAPNGVLGDDFVLYPKIENFCRHVSWPRFCD